MKNVEVLLRENIPTLGRCGEVVAVRPGFARNYLLPQKLATQATPENKLLMERRRVRLDAEEAALNAEIDARIAVLNALEFKTVEKADEQGHLYGSVNAHAVVGLLAQRGQTFSDKDVRLEAPIKSVGTYQVRLHVRAERYAELTVVVEREGGMPEPVAVPAAEAPPSTADEA